MKKELVTIATHSFERSELLKTLLEDRGIPVVVERVNLLGGTFQGGERIKVFEEDAEQAMKIVERAYSRMTEQEPSPIEKRKEVRLLVPIDFERDLSSVYDLAFQLASQTGGKIMFLHVYYSPLLASMTFHHSFSYGAELDSSMQEIRSKAEMQMQSLMQELSEKIENGSYPKVHIESTLLGGIAEDEIVSFSEEYQPNVILMNHSTEENNTIGSVSAEVMARVDTPVFIIPAKSKSIDFNRPIHLMFLTNFEEKDFTSFDKLQRILSPFDIVYSLVHFSPVEQENTWDEALIKGMKEIIQSRYGKEKHINTFIEPSSDLPESVEKYVKEKHVNVIAMTTRKRNLLVQLFHPSLTRKVLFYGNKPLLAFHS